MSRRSRVLTGHLRERVVVTLKSGDSFNGLLYTHDDRVLELRQAQALGAGEKSTDLPLDGTLLVLMADVAFIQIP